jgi:hypothetical protein
MAEYRHIEYRISKDGKITERVINGSGTDCTETTKGIEDALGEVYEQNLLPEYYNDTENSSLAEIQSINEM